MPVRFVLFGLVAVAGTAMAPSASAQSAGAFMINPAFQDPAPKTCNTTFDMQHCAAHELRIADADMSRRYSALRTRLSPAGRQRLLAEQRKWLARRDSGCLAKGDRYEGGTMAVVVLTQCWVDVTQARARDLARRQAGVQRHQPG